MNKFQKKPPPAAMVAAYNRAKANLAWQKCCNFAFGFLPQKNISPANDHYDYSATPVATEQKFMESRRKFVEKLKKHGFKEIGSGFYSSVYHKKGDRVIKVNSNMDDWIDYVMWAEKNGYAGNLAPKVYSYKNYGDFSVAVMEKLETTLHHTPSTHRMKIVPTLLNFHLHNPANDNGKYVLELIAPGVIEFNNRLKDHFTSLDFHGGNFMIRKGGGFVFTDPTCGRKKTTIQRFKTAA